MLIGLPAAPPEAAFEAACAAVLDYLKTAVPMGYWSVSRYDGERQLYLQVRDDVYGTKAGDSHAWSDSFCQFMVQGSPPVAPDAQAIPEYAAAGVNNAIPIGAYVGIPIEDGDGGLFGTICGLDPARQSEAMLEHAPLLRLLGSLLTTILQAEQGRIEHEQLARSAREAAETDVLTGVCNRRGWERFLLEEEARYAAFGDPASLLMLDLDGLKVVNDSQGHAAGDELIRRTAHVLRSHLRSHDMIARLGGDEFGIVLTRIAPAAAEALVDRLREALAQAGIAASFGCSPYSLADGFQAAWQRADVHLYADKRSRRTRRAA
jgi:diguanylate cyclase